jgi:hypothetical protein
VIRGATQAWMFGQSWRGGAWACPVAPATPARQRCHARRAGATGPYKGTAHLLFPPSLLSPFILAELEVTSVVSILSLPFLSSSNCLLSSLHLQFRFDRSRAWGMTPSPLFFLCLVDVYILLWFTLLRAILVFVWFNESCFG